MLDRVTRFLVVLLVFVVIVGVLPASTALAAESAPPLQYAVDQQLAQPIVIVNTSFLNVRSGPGAIYSIIGTLPGGTELPVLGRNRDASWWQVESIFGNGWVSAEFVVPRGDFRAVPVVQVTGITVEPRAAVVGGPVNVYVFPDMNASLLGLSLNGSELPIVGQTADGAWWQVETNVGLGWVMQNTVSLRGNAANVPVTGAQTDGAAVLVPPPSGTDATMSTGSTVTSTGMTTSFTGSENPIALVLAEQLQVKAGGSQDAEGVGQLQRGDRVEVLDISDDGDYVLVLYTFNRMGWVSVNDVALSDPSDWRTQVYFDGPGVLDLKASNSLDSMTVAMVPSGERLVVVNDADGGWLQVTHAEGTGWIQGMDIDVIRNGPRTAPAGASAPSVDVSGTTPQLSGNVFQPSGAPSVQPARAQSYVIVNTSFLNVRSGPGANYTTVGTLSGGVELDIMGSTPDGAWFKVQGDFGMGWVNSEFVIFRGDFGNVPIIRYQDAVGQQTAPQIVVAAPINVYLGVGVDTGLLGTAPTGLTIPVIGRTADGNWLQVQTSSGNGWVLSSTVSFQGNLAQVPVVG
jgi:uncharacterized protein YraI